MKKLFFKSPDNIVSVTIRFLQSLHVKVTDSAVAKTLLSHPDYPSLLSVSNALQSWHIETLALQVTAEQLPDLPLPLLTHINNDEASFVIITELTDEYVVYTDDKGSRVQIDKNTFLNVWDGNVLLAETNAKSGEENYKSKVREEVWSRLQTPLLLLLWVVTGVAKAASFWLQEWPTPRDKIYFTCLLITHVTGMLVSGLLLLYDYDNDNSTLQKLCTAGGAQSDCSAVLNSKASKLFGIISWADVGLIYFCGGYVYLLIAPNDADFFLPPVLLSALALPYTVFSVVYQATIVKQWCVLCLTIQAVLLFQFLSGFSTGYFRLPVLSGWYHIHWLSLWTAYFIPLAAWAILKPYLYKKRDADDVKKDLMKFKGNADIFHHLLTQNIPVHDGSMKAGILLGEASSSGSIILVTNPFCGACGDAHAELEQLLRIRSDRNAELIFFVSNDEEDIAYLVVAHLLALAQAADDPTVHHAITDWYEKKDYTSFSKAYPVSEAEMTRQRERILSMNTWCLSENITFTPCAYVDGFRLPKEYSLSDLAYL